MTEIHPLLNSVVLTRLFELIPFDFKEYENFRLVSKTWYNQTLPVWRKNVWISISTSPSKENPKEIQNSDFEYSRKGISLEEYLDHLDKNNLNVVHYPFRKYSIEGWNISLQNDVIFSFWKRMGPQMTHLSIKCSQFARVDDLRHILFQFTPNLKCLKLIQNVYKDKRPENKVQRLNPKLPQHILKSNFLQRNLVELEIELVEEFGPEVNLPITWMELLLHFPNIHKLGPLRMGCTQPIAELREFFEAVEILRRENGLKYFANLSELDIMQETRGRPEAMISCITRLQFPLKRLALNIGWFTQKTVLKRLLETCCNSLENLSVNRGTPPPIDLAPLPNFPFGLKFPHLKELSLSGPVTPNLMFLQEIPSLELLKYKPTNEARFEQKLDEVLLRGSKMKAKNLKDLSIISDGCSAVEICKLGQLIPNVRKLQIGLDNEGFREVCKTWRKLESIEIVPFRVGEEGILGKDEKGKGGANFLLPNITQLQDLKVFKMQRLMDSSSRFGLTNKVVLKGILALKFLEEVDLTLSSEVKSIVCSQLLEKIPRSKILVLGQQPTREGRQERGGGDN
ncbi:unnamed protein product [Orchesella dallaii]|uniref:F-box domain-containing protein n=1 Tax=Orchesella dallaii TaxID=48710 RepID=A0ABP1S035_9HEXA